MKFFSKLRLNARFSIVILTIMVVTFSLFGYFIFSSQKDILEEKTTDVLKSQMEDLVSIIQLENLIDSLQNENKTKLSPGYILNSLRQKNIDSSSINKSLNEIIDIKTLIGNLNSSRQLEKSELFKNLIYHKRYFDDGFAFCMNSEGKVIIHPYSELEGDDLRTSTLYQEINEGGKNPIRYKSQVNKNEWSRAYYSYNAQHDWYIIISVSEESLIGGSLRQLRTIVMIIIIVTAVLFYFGMRLLLKRYVVSPLQNIVFQLKKLSHGSLAEKIAFKNHDEIGDITNNLNNLVDGLRKTAGFANKIGQGELDADFSPLSQNDVLGNSLLEMRESLKKAKKEENNRRVEDEKRSWATQGLAKFGDILRRDNDNLDVLAFNVVKNLVSYIDVNLCGLFILNDDDPEYPYIELVATYAYDRKKYLEKKVEIGEGLVGSCFKEKNTIYLKEVPEDYIHVSSGLGENSPNELLLVPLKINDEIYGVIEIAAFKKLEEYEINFIEKIGESIASTISSVKINIKTTELLEKSQQQAEEMRAQEEEMRQNMEELTATQEALAEKDRENQRKLKELNQAHISILEEVKFKEEQNRNILQNAIDGVIVIDKNGIINFFNQSAEKIFGYKQNEVLGRNIKILMPEELAENHDDYIRHYVETGHKKVIDTSRPVPIKMKNGAVKDAILALTETKVKDESVFTGFIKDLSAYGKDQNKLLKKVKLLKQCEENLENTEEQFKNTVSRYNGLIKQYKSIINLELDHEFRITQVNDALLKLLKISSQEKIINEDFELIVSENFKQTEAFKNLQAEIDKKHHIEEIIELKISKLKSTQVKANIAKFENKIDNEIRYIFVFTNITDLIENLKLQMPKVEQESVKNKAEEPKEKVAKGENKDLIIQLEDELGKALEEIDELKAQLAKKK